MAAGAAACWARGALALRPTRGALAPALALALRPARPGLLLRPCARALSGGGATPAVELIRNIGICAHIDAGKTTLSERVLFYSGESSAIGEVHDGDTVMDFLEQERERGITINSAAISFQWSSPAAPERALSVNLIDTPGHVDFTVEVERSVRALDGAVACFDAVAGVQAQSETVWRQAQRYGVARIAFINKMDRVGADYRRAVAMIEQRFGAVALVTQLPLLDEEGALRGVVDLASMQVHVWDQQTKHAREWQRTPCSAYEWPQRNGSPKALAEVSAAREALANRLSDVDDQFADQYLAALDEGKEPSEQQLRLAIRRATVRQSKTQAVPVLCGSALKNTGVQLLMDAVVDYLPDPAEAALERAGLNDEEQETADEAAPQPAAPAPKAPAPGKKGGAGGKHVAPTPPHKQQPNQQQQQQQHRQQANQHNDKAMVALCFKVQHDPQRGPLSFVRVYRGVLEAKQQFHNVTALRQAERSGSAAARERARKERANQLLRAFANEFESIDAIGTGDIGIIVGAKHVRTGDSLSSEPGLVPLRGVQIPRPVFTASLELESAADEPKLLEALEILTRDDPSLVAVQDDETAQLLLSGMGELHLDIALSKLQRDFKLPCAFTRVRVAYRETLLGEAEAVGVFSPALGGGDAARKDPNAMHVALRLSPHPGGINEPACIAVEGRPWSLAGARAPKLTFRAGGDSEAASWQLKVDQFHALAAGALDALKRGPTLGYPVQGVMVEVLEEDSQGPAAGAPDHLRAAAAMAVLKVLQHHKAAALPALIEPKAKVQVSCPDRFVGPVISDLTSARRAMVQDVVSEAAPGPPAAGSFSQARSTVHAAVPLEGLLGYSTALRSMTAGEASFEITVDGYTLVLHPDKVVKG